MPSDPSVPVSPTGARPAPPRIAWHQIQLSKNPTAPADLESSAASLPSCSSSSIPCSSSRVPHPPRGSERPSSPIPPRPRPIPSSSNGAKGSRCLIPHPSRLAKAGESLIPSPERRPKRGEWRPGSLSNNAHNGECHAYGGNVIRSPGNAPFPLLRASFPRGNTARSPVKAPRRAHPRAERPRHAEPRIPEIPSRRGLTNRSTGSILCTSLPSVKRILPRTLRRW
jgi:hypothetical protein